MSTLLKSWTAGPINPGGKFPSEGVINQYLLDEADGNIIDSVGGNNGIVTGTLGSGDAVINKGRKFDATTSIALSSVHTFLMTDDITISFWFKPDSISGITYQLIDRTTNIGSIVACYLSNTTLSFRIRGSNSAGLTTIDYPLAVTVPGVWYHVICEKNAITHELNLWVNGVKKRSATVETTTADIGPLTLKLGASQNGVNHFMGYLDELRIYKRILSYAEKKNSYNYGRNSHGERLDRGHLVITFDDSTASLYTGAFPLLQAQGVSATLYTQTNVIGMASRLTWAELTEMYNAGIDLQCHTNSGTSLPTLDEAGVIAELQAVNAAFVAHALPVPQHIGYPQGQINDTVEAWIRNSGLRVSGRQVNPYSTIYPYVNKMRMGSYGIDNINEAGVITLKAMLDDAQYYRHALILYGHGVSEAGGATEVSAANLNEIINYAKSIGVSIDTMAELYEVIK